MKIFKRSLFLLIGLFTTFSFNSFALYASEPKVNSFRFGKEMKRFLNFPSKRITISADCGTNLLQMTCMAAQSLKTASMKDISVKQLASRNPGSVVCTENLHQKVVIGTDPHRNENSFCLFQDGSLLDNGTLHYYARRN